MSILNLVLFTAFFHCTKPFEKTDEVIDREVFVNIMTEMYLYKNMNPGLINGINLNYKDVNGHLLQKYHITAKQFEVSYSYYMMNARSSKKIFKEIKKKLIDYIPDYKEEPTVPGPVVNP